MGMGLGGANDSIGCNLMSWRIAFSTSLTKGPKNKAVKNTFDVGNYIGSSQSTFE
jgi:hypothetical protein